MKSIAFFITSLFYVSFINFAFTQNDSLHRTMQVVKLISEALDVYNSCHYKAQMRFKEMGADSFEIRDFSVSYKSNEANPLYGYDWEISEEVNSGYAHTHLSLPEALYVIYEGTKGIGKYNLPRKIDLGSYTEYIRSYLILHEVFLHFAHISSEDILLKDSGNYYYLTRQMNEIATQQLVISKATYLPSQFISTIRDLSLDLVQITEINYYYDDDIMQLPANAFSPDHYLSSGYTLKSIEDDQSFVQEETNSLTAYSKELLLNYPFVTDEGDTTSIVASKARYILLDFWYSSCLPCLKAMPVLNQLAEDNADAGLKVIGINCFDMDIRKTLVKKLRDKNITIPLFFGSRDLIRSLNITRFPSYILITPDGEVEFMEGYIDDVKKVLDQIFGN